LEVERKTIRSLTGLLNRTRGYARRSANLLTSAIPDWSNSSTNDSDSFCQGANPWSGANLNCLQSRLTVSA